MSHHLILFKEDGKFWIDTGHADVGPFDTRKAAREHMDRIITSREEREKYDQIQLGLR